MLNLITRENSLPTIPLKISLVGRGLVLEELICSPIIQNSGDSPEAIMANWRNKNSPEKLPYRRLYWIEKKRGEAIIHLKLTRRGKKTGIIGKVPYDMAAVKIMIGNDLKGCYLAPIRWELYEDFSCENLIDMGRFDYWDLLKDVSKAKLIELADRGIKLRGNWDFDNAFWSQKCQCGNRIVINAIVYNIDSAVCNKCGNRPFLSNSLGRILNLPVNFDTNYGNEAFSHILRWLNSVNSDFQQANITNNELVLKLWENTLMAAALNTNTQDNVAALVEANTQFDFSSYLCYAEILKNALTGTTEINRSDIKSAIHFVVKANQLIGEKKLIAS